MDTMVCLTCSLEIDEYTIGPDVALTQMVVCLERSSEMMVKDRG